MTPERSRNALTLVLVVTSGATDAVGYLALGGAHSFASLVALVSGAAAGALLCSWMPVCVPVLQLSLLLGVLASVRLVRRPRQEPVCA